MAYLLTTETLAGRQMEGVEFVAVISW